MIRLLRKLYYGWLLGQHVCEEYTQWVRCAENVQLIHHQEGVVIGEPIEITRHWQERRCTLCGRLYQSPLSFG